jgi:hypothetical protein
VGYSGTDPGITDVATVAHFKVVDGTNQPTETSSYSSSRYYEAAKIKLSARRTARWNEETSDEHIMLSRDMDTSTMEGQEALVTDYLDVVRGLIDHRFNKGYRNMRFLRYVFKQKAVNEICNMIAPPDQFTVVGFGDWNGPGRTCIKRRYCGPLQDIKRELKRRTDSVAFRTVWEYLTSMTCHLTWKRLTNMVAASTTQPKRRPGLQGAVEGPQVLTAKPVRAATARRTPRGTETSTPPFSCSSCSRSVASTARQSFNHCPRGERELKLQTA